MASSSVADLAEAAAFGPLLWAEAAQRGVLDAGEVVVLADGSHWIWNLAATYFPHAVQILGSGRISNGHTQPVRMSPRNALHIQRLPVLMTDVHIVAPYEQAQADFMQ